MIHKSATRIVELFWPNGNSVVLWLGHNSNTGDPIVWQVVKRNGVVGRSERFTGRRIGQLADEVKMVLGELQGTVEVHSAAGWRMFMEASTRTS